MVPSHQYVEDSGTMTCNRCDYTVTSTSDSEIFYIVAWGSESGDINFRVIRRSTGSAGSAIVCVSTTTCLSRSSSDSDDSSNVCFAGDQTVALASGYVRRISDVQIGDEIQATFFFIFSYCH